MNVCRASLWASATLLVACASERPANTSGFDDSAGLVEIFVAGDGFVRCDGERLPLDAMVLRLRQRTRAMTRDQLSRFVVQLRVAEGVVDGPAAKIANDGMNRMLRELEVMGVTQARWL